MKDVYISKAVIKRLPRYHRFLGELAKEGVERISSNDLAEMMNVTASQIRQDLNHFGGFGQQGYGYNVRYLHEEIGNLLGLNKEHKMVIIGAGNLARAITNYYGFKEIGFHIVGLFDVSEELIGSEIKGIPVRPLSELSDFAKKEEIDLAILTVPKDAANAAAEEVVTAGIQYIWNFAPTELIVDRKKVYVENVHLVDSLLELTFEMTTRPIKESK